MVLLMLICNYKLRNYNYQLHNYGIVNAQFSIQNNYNNMHMCTSMHANINTIIIITVI